MFSVPPVCHSVAFSISDLNDFMFTSQARFFAVSLIFDFYVHYVINNIFLIAQWTV